MKSMDKELRSRLEAAGFRETNVQDLLGLTPEEVELVETRLALSRLVKRLRAEKRLTQRAAAAMVRSDQSNLSKAEANDPEVSVDWLIRVAIALGASRQEIGRALSA
jgi:hypothetical protein